jgi:Vitamin K epoxide reductase family
VITTGMATFSAYLMSLLVFRIGASCPYCITSVSTGILFNVPGGGLCRLEQAALTTQITLAYGIATSLIIHVAQPECFKH